jgi:putative drug exporter of the RND superfamily
MFETLGRFVVRHAKGVLACVGVFMIVALAILVRGGPLASGIIEGLEARQEEHVADSVTGTQAETTFVVLLHSENLDPRDEAFQVAMKDALEPLRKDPRVLSVTSADDAPTFMRARMVNVDARGAIAFVSMRESFQDALISYPNVRSEMVSKQLEIGCTGTLPYFHDLNETLEQDLIRAEIISLPFAILILLWVFRTAAAAVLPALVGGLAVAGGVAVVMALSHSIEVAKYTINVCSLVGLGVAIDYSLFIVSRYREELAAGHAINEAIARAVGSAGRVVAFSGVAVGTGLAGLLFFRGSYLFTMGIGGSIVVLLSVVFALTFLPAMLAVLGPKIHWGALPRSKNADSGKTWRAISHFVMKHPVLVLLPTLGFLLMLGSPFLHVKLAAADVRVLDQSSEARRAYDRFRRDFSDASANRIDIAIEFPTSPALTVDRIGAIYDLSRRLKNLPHVLKVESLVDRNDPDQEEPSKEDYQEILIDPPPMVAPMIEAAKKMLTANDVVLLHVVTDGAPESDEARALVRTLRSDRKVLDGHFIVGGRTANDIDTTDFMLSRAPRAAVFVVSVMVVVLFFLLKSALLPIKAALMNFVSIAGSFGALVWIFQDGHLLPGEPRPLEPTLPVLLFCVLFGLSMDYEVLMLSRMKEAYERTGDNLLAVGEGVEKTASLITSAAAIMVAVFVAFALARVVLVRAVGLGMALAVTLDATLVRVLLVPATMRLLGDWNWWPNRRDKKP